MAPSKETVVERIVQSVEKYWISDETKEGNSEIMDWVDLLLEYAPEEGEKLLAKLRELKIFANQYGPCQEASEVTVDLCKMSLFLDGARNNDFLVVEQG